MVRSLRKVWGRVYHDDRQPRSMVTSEEKIQEVTIIMYFGVDSLFYQKKVTAQKSINPVFDWAALDGGCSPPSIPYRDHLQLLVWDVEEQEGQGHPEALGVV